MAQSLISQLETLKDPSVRTQAALIDVALKAQACIQIGVPIPNAIGEALEKLGHTLPTDPDQ